MSRRTKKEDSLNYKSDENQIMKSNKLALEVNSNVNTTDLCVLKNEGKLARLGEDTKSIHGKYLKRPTESQELEIYEKTKKALDLVLDRKQDTLHPFKESKKENKTEFIKYRSSSDTIGYDPKFAERIIKVVERPKDPLELPKFRNRILGGTKREEMVPILRPPSKKLTQEEIKEWSIPPSISNWKNPMGYTVPLDKRVQADTRDLIDISVNDRFASLSESLKLAEKNAREQIKLRNELQKQKKIREEMEREEKLRKLAESSRSERSHHLLSKIPEFDQDKKEGSEEETSEFDHIRRLELEKRREIEREFRQERAGKKSKTLRDSDRDISEHIALGQARSVDGGSSSEVQFDARLFNRISGLDSGFSNDTISVYDKPLFNTNSLKSRGLYTFEESRVEESIGGRVHVPSFSGTDNSNTAFRTKPVEFERDDDPFGLDKLIDSVRKDKKK
ncbi:SNW family nuclear protein [Cryptosporidium ubiquitum]|uniref:SNW family nuclear protein n=1 Tax=Cryptosporidium ubiquitum TaxID=857276 RepID=A0A1J4MF11_9CRYT|nr:SNW family nuclear protein [Cryptosporidium ubiquitum]OII72793.1 SNW family nuclear protein [Cryptosporidium ubiquitum]